jgi:hypothetical protein
MARNRYSNISRESFHPTDFNDITSDTADIDVLDSILDNFSRTTADFSMISNQSLDNSKKEELASDIDTPGIGYIPLSLKGNTFLFFRESSILLSSYR